MIVFAESDGTWVAVAMSGVAGVIGVLTLIVNKTAERRQARDKLEFGAELVALKSDRDECMAQHALKDIKIDHLERRLDDCHKDHEASNRDREKLWEAVRAMQAGPV